MTITTTPNPTSVAPTSTWKPPLVRLAWRRYLLELRIFRRVREEMVFTLALPIMLLGLFAVIFGGEIDDTGVDFSQYFVAGMLASTGLTAGFQSLSGQLALEQHDGTLKRLAGTPMPKAAYMAGKIGMICTVAIVQMITMFVLGVAVFKVTLPSVGGWFQLIAVLLLNLAIWTFLGLAFSSLIRSPRAGSAVAVPPALVLQFISGVYIPFDQIPGWLANVASLFPLRWATLGMRQALLPDSFKLVEPGATWQTSTMYLMLVGWLVAGAVLAGILFRWRVQE